MRDEYSILEHEQSSIFWNKTKNLEVFSNSKSNLLRVVVPMSETVNVIQKLKAYDINYFLDWGGSLIWLQIEELEFKNSKRN